MADEFDNSHDGFWTLPPSPHADDETRHAFGCSSCGSGVLVEFPPSEIPEDTWAEVSRAGAAGGCHENLGTVDEPIQCKGLLVLTDPAETARKILGDEDEVHR